MASGMNFMGLPLEAYYNLNYGGWQQAFGQGWGNPYDLNRDGLVDTRDWGQYRQYQQAYPNGYQPPPQQPPPVASPPYQPPPPQSISPPDPGPYANPSGSPPAPLPPSPDTPPALGPPGGSNPRDYWNYTPEAGYAQRLSEQGLSGNDPYGNYARGQYSRYYNQYQADAAKDPNEGFYDWYMKAGINPRGEFTNLAPSQRGDFTSQTLAPRARWSTS